MARFDVYRLNDGSMVVDCQADFLKDIGTRFVLPLLPRGEGPGPNVRINPEFEVNGERLVLVAQLAATLRTTELRTRVTSLAEDSYRIIGAIDVLIGTA
jgi:toxin CcdB